MTKWRRLKPEDIKESVFSALQSNVSYTRENVLGVPGSFLDPKVFNPEASFLKDSPFLSSLLENPNHIGCHTLNNSEPFFYGTQRIEREVLRICAVDILKSSEDGFDGYIASGGTEANIQALWIYRNFFKEIYETNNKHIVVICSNDSHYSFDKGANILNLDLLKVQVNEQNRQIDIEDFRKVIKEAKEMNKHYFIIICNMMTTMFGSVDDVDEIGKILKEEHCTFKIHIDGAYGGFYHPFTTFDSTITFQNPLITSFTLDAHKMAQAPYGTGIFLIRKNFIQFSQTEQAKYVKGDDFTLVGSRSGANTIAVWMILATYGPHGWKEKIQTLERRTDWLSEELSNLGIKFFRAKSSNILTIQNSFVSQEIAKKYWLVPDDHEKPK